MQSMSQRELKALRDGEQPLLSSSRLRSGKTAMGEEQSELERLIEELRAENSGLKEKSVEITQQLEDQQDELEQLRRERDEASTEADRYYQQVEDGKTAAELERLRVLESLRVEHQRALRREQDLADSERERARGLVEERAILEKRVCVLSRELEALRASQVSTPEVVVGATPTTEHSSITTESGRGTRVTWSVTTESDSGTRESGSGPGTGSEPSGAAESGADSGEVRVESTPPPSSSRETREATIGVAGASPDSGSRSANRLHYFGCCY